MDVTYDILRRSIQQGTKDISDEESFNAWCKKNHVDAPSLRQMSQECAVIALEDMRDGERGLLEGLAGTLLSGFIAAFEMLRPAITDETFDFIAQGKKVSVKIANIEDMSTKEGE